LTTANYFEVLGLHPILGRGFLPEEERPRTGAAVAVISYSVWENHCRIAGQLSSRESIANKLPLAISISLRSS
jgi:hypothetical protein